VTRKVVRPLFKNVIPLNLDIAFQYGVCASLLLQQVHYLSEVEREAWQGYLWVSRTAAEWAKELGGLYGESTIRHALRDLHKANLLIVLPDPRRVGTFYRVNYFEVSKNEQRGWSKSPDQMVESTTHLNTKGDLGDCVDTALPSEVHTREPSAIQELTPGKRVKTVFKIVKTPTPGGKPVAAKRPAKSDSILAAIQKKKANLPEVMPNSKDSAKVIWRTAPQYNPEMPGMMPAETVKDLSLLRQMADRLGPTCDRDLRLAVENWLKFTSFVCDYKGYSKSFKTPLVPSLQFMAANVEALLAFGQKMAAKAAEEAEQEADDKPVEAATIAPSPETQPVTSPTPAAHAPLPEKDQPITMEELEAYEAGTLKLPK
jgi:hypothetical protein